MQLENKLLNSPLQQLVPKVQPITNSEQPLSQVFPSNQNSQLTQNSSLKGPRRRNKKCQIGRNFKCQCGKSYLSLAALNHHIKIKHPEWYIKKNVGRPPKYPNKSKNDFEKTKYNIFFIQNGRSPENEKSFDILSLVQEAFNFIYEAPSSIKLFSKPKSFKEIPILLNLISKNNIINKAKNEKTCDDAFTEYLINFIDKTNKMYFLFMIKFVLLFKEFYDLYKNKEKKDEEKKTITNSLQPNELPYLCNEFYNDFLKMNNFFGINEDEIVEIIQHFCIWLFKNDFTKAKLFVAS